jgi:hypothetical protein
MAAIGAAVSVGLVLTAWKGKVSWPVAGVVAAGMPLAVTLLLTGRWCCMRQPATRTAVVPQEGAQPRKTQAEPVPQAQAPAQVTVSVPVQVDRSRPPIHLKSRDDVKAWLKDPQEKMLWVYEMDLPPTHGAPQPWQQGLPKFTQKLKPLADQLAVILVQVRGREGPLLKLRTDVTNNPSAPDGDPPRGNTATFWLESLDGQTKVQVNTELQKKMTFIGVRKESV